MRQSLIEAGEIRLDHAWGDEAGFGSWHRCVVLHWNECVEITDYWKF